MSKNSQRYVVVPSLDLLLAGWGMPYKKISRIFRKMFFWEETTPPFLWLKPLVTTELASVTISFTFLRPHQLFIHNTLSFVHTVNLFFLYKIRLVEELHVCKLWIRSVVTVKFLWWLGGQNNQSIDQSASTPVHIIGTSNFSD